MKISAIAVPVIDPERLEQTEIGKTLQDKCCILSACGSADDLRCRNSLYFYERNRGIFKKIAAKYWGEGLKCT